jgi:hypothetical protein
MCLECLELTGQHFVVSVAADQDNVVELTIESQFICVKGEPCVYSFFYNTAVGILAQVLVVEDDVVLDQSVLEFPFASEKVSLNGVMSTVTSL